MKLKSMMALAIAAAFALPAAAQMSPRTDTTTGGPVHSGTNSADRPANTPKADTNAPAATPGGAVTSGTNAADRTPNTPKSETGAAAGSSSTAGGFGGVDRNGDGFISREEARDATWSNRFTEFDKDNDGRLSQSEFDAMQGAASGSGAGVSSGHSGSGASTTGGMGGSVGPAGTQSGSSTSGVGDKPGQKQ